MTETKVFTIRTAAQALNRSEQYIRKCIREGKLDSTLVQVGSSNVQRHEITATELAKFSARTAVRSSREDGRNKYAAYMTAGEYKAVIAALNEAKLGAVAKLIVRANPSKKS